MDDLRLLTQSAQTRDKNAFGQLVERFQDMAFALAYARVGHRQQAEDIAQEAFIEAYLHIDSLTSPLAFTSWFRVIINRQVNRFMRRKQPSIYPLETINAHSTDEPSPQQYAESRDLQEVIHGALRSLPEDERQVILLFFIAGYAQKEIGDMLNLRVSTVKSRLYEARKKLRERIDFMVEETLQDQRPSNNPQFIKSVMAFIDAIENNRTSLATELLEREPRLLNTPGKLSYDKDSLPPLFLAIQKGNMQLIDYFLSKGANVNIRLGRADETALHWAVGRQPDQALPIGKYLLENGAEVDAVTKSGATPLHWAVTGGNLDVIKLLLQNGADPNSTSGLMTESPLMRAKRLEHVEVHQLFRSWTD